MDEADLEKYIKEMSNSKRNRIKIRIIESLLGLEFASKMRLWKDMFVYVRKNYRYLPSSYPDPTLRSNEIILRDRFESTLSSLKRDGIVTERKGRDELMIGLDSPVADYDDDHPLFELCWDQLGVEQEDPVEDENENGEIADVVRHMTVDKQLRDEVSAEAGDKSEPKRKDKPSYMKSILKKISEVKGTEDFDELPLSMRRQVAYGIVYQTELDLRKFVEDVLNGDTDNANWWKDKVPQDVRDAVHKRIEKKKETRAKSDIKLEGVTRLLNDTDMSNLVKIILYGKNMQAFEKAFVDKGLKNVTPFLILIAERRSTCDIMHPDETVTMDKEFVAMLDELCVHVKKLMETYYNITPSRETSG